MSSRTGNAGLINTKMAGCNEIESNIWNLGFRIETRMEIRNGH